MLSDSGESVYASYSKTKLFGGLQKQSVPLVPPSQFFPQDFQLAEKLFNPGAARVLCTDQPVALLRKKCETDERMWWLRTGIFLQNIELN